MHLANTTLTANSTIAARAILIPVRGRRIRCNSLGER
jgi:hypothetical protein